MKTASPQLQALIEGGEFFRCDLYTITLVDGTIIRTTTADIDLIWGGNQFLHGAPVIEREKIKTSLGLEVDALSISIFYDSTNLLVGLPLAQAIRLGALDGATVLLEKAYLASWSAGVVGVLHGFYGSVSDIDGGRGSFDVEVKSALEELNTEMPRNLYQSTCLHTVYDTGCGLLRSAYTVTGAVVTGGTLSQTQFLTNLGQADRYFENGVIAFTSGANNGSRRTVKTHFSARLTFALPLPNTPSVGDTFSIYPGCPRTMDACDTKFGNLVHFKAFPFIPAPESVYS